MYNTLSILNSRIDFKQISKSVGWFCVVRKDWRLHCSLFWHARTHALVWEFKRTVCLPLSAEPPDTQEHTFYPQHFRNTITWPFNSQRKLASHRLTWTPTHSERTNRSQPHVAYLKDTTALYKDIYSSLKGAWISWSYVHIPKTFAKQWCKKTIHALILNKYSPIIRQITNCTCFCVT